MKTTLFTLAIILLSFASQAQKMTVKRVERVQTSETGTWFSLREAPVTARTYYLETRQTGDTYTEFVKAVKDGTLTAVHGYKVDGNKFYKLVTYTTGSDTTKAERDEVRKEIINDTK